MKFVVLIAPMGFLLGGCVHHLPAAVSSASINGTSEIPVQVVTGKSYATYFLGMGPFGDDSLKAALDDAKSKAPSDSMMNVFVDRRVKCIPLCALPMLVDVETSVSGTLIRYSALKSENTPPVGAIRNLPTPLETDAPEITYSKMLENFAVGRARGEEFHQGLPPKGRADLKEFIVRRKGNGSGWNWKLRFEAGMTPGEREMLEWYVRSFTDYSPQFER